MLELHVTDSDVTGGSISVGWCVSIDTLNMLAERGIKNPVVVLCTAPADSDTYAYRREYRKVVPLKDLVGYVEFRSSGKNNIWGFIAADEKQARHKFLEKDGVTYHKSILRYDGSEWCGYKTDLNSGSPYLEENDILNLLSEPVSVLVPEEAFAAEPAAWEKAWVNHFLDRNVVDQCDFRRRRLFAYTVQPVIMFFNLLLRFLFFCMASLFGTRGWSINPIIHPLSYSMEDASKVATGGTWFIGRGENKWLNYARLPFMPIFFFGYYLLYKCHAMQGAAYILMGAVALALLVAGGLATIFWVSDRRDARLKLEPAWFLNDNELQYIVCNANGTKATNLQSLPSSKRTLRLRIQDLKTRVCRPFSA